MEAAHNKYFNVTILDTSVFTILTTDPEFVNSWIRDIVFPYCDATATATSSPPPIQGGLIVGVDIKGQPPATIQLCINGRCLIYHMPHDEPTLPFDLQLLMTNPINSFFGVGLGQYHSVFGHNMPIRNLGFLAAVRYNRPDLLHAGMSELASTVLGKELVMPSVNPDWNGAELLDEQVIHACIGAFLSYQLGKKLLEGN